MCIYMYTIESFVKCKIGHLNKCLLVATFSRVIYQLVEGNKYHDVIHTDDLSNTYEIGNQPN